MRHEAIYNLYPIVVAVDDGAGAFDAQGNQVTVDEDAIAAEIQRLQPIKAAEIASRNRQQAYIADADPLFFKAQRGEATMEEWQAKVAEIKQRFPKSE
jgi:hypothetical protein